MQNPLVIDVLLERKQNEYQEFLFAILEWEAFLGNKKTWNTIVKKFFYHINKKTPSKDLAIEYLRRLSRGNNILVAPLQMQLQLIYKDLEKTSVAKKNINEFLDYRLKFEVNSFEPTRKNIVQNIDKYVFCVSTIDSVLRCFATQEDSLLHGIYAGKICAAYINSSVIFHYQEICDIYLHDIDCTLEIENLIESGVEEEDVLQKISIGAIRAIHKESRLLLHKEDTFLNYPNFTTVIPSPPRGTTDIVDRVEKSSKKLEKSDRSKIEARRSRRRTPFEKPKGKKSTQEKSQKIRIDIEPELSLTKRIEETLLQKEDQKIKQRHRLVVDSEELGLTGRIKNALLQQDTGITQRIKKAVGKTEKSSVSQNIIELFSAIGKTIKFVITMPLIVVTFPFKIIFSTGKKIFLWFKQRDKQKIAEVEIPAFEAMLSEEAGRPGMIERTLSQSRLLLKLLQMTIGLRIVVFINFCDSLVEFAVGYITNIYRTWKMGKSIKRRIERCDAKMQIAGLTSDLEVVRSHLSKLFQFSEYNQKELEKAFALNLIYDVRYRMDEMKRDLSLLTKEQMTHTAKNTMWDFVKSFVPNPLELFTPCKDFIIFAFFMKYSRKDIHIMYGEMLMSYRLIIQNLDENEHLLLENYEDLIIMSTNKSYDLRDIELHINECKQQIQRFIQVLANPRKMINARYFSIEDLSYEYCHQNCTPKQTVRLELQLQFEKILRKQIEKKFTKISSKWHLQDKMSFERRYRLQKQLCSSYLA